MGWSHSRRFTDPLATVDILMHTTGVSSRTAQTAAIEKLPPATPYRPLVLAALAAGLGVMVDRSFSGAPLGWLAWWTASASCWLLARGARRLQCHRAGAVFALLAIAGLFAAWSHLRWNYFAANDLGLFAADEPQPACLEVVLAEPIKHMPPPPPDPLRAAQLGPISEAVVEVFAIRDGRHWRSASGVSRLRVAGKLTDVQPGDRLRVFASIARPYRALNPGQYDWSAAERGRRRISEIYCRTPDCVSRVSASSSAGARTWLSSTRLWCRDQLAQWVGPRDEDLALAVLLGARERLTDSTTRAFMLTGTIHLLVISGLHVGILAAIVWQALSLVQTPRSWALCLTAAAVLAYAAVTGPRPPVIRASLLVLLMLFALGVGRKVSPMQLLAAAALAVLIYNPSELFHSGTQLSFLSVAALVLFGHFVVHKRNVDPLRRLLADARPWPIKAIRGAAWKFVLVSAASLLVWLVAAPLVAYHFHVSTPGGVILSPLIWPLIALAIAAGATVLAFGWFIPPVGLLGGWICASSLQLTERMVHLAHSVDAGHLYCAGPRVWWLWGFYAALALPAALPRLRFGVRWLAAFLMTWIAIGLAAASRPRLAHDELRCTFLAMGHGTCAVLELPGGQTLLYDAGSLGSPEGASRTIAAFLWERGISRIDAIVLSHADVDHYNAVPGLLERFPTGVVYVAPPMFGGQQQVLGPTTAPEILRQVIDGQGVPLREIWMTDRLDVGDPRIEITVHHPPRSGVAGRDNANSVLLTIEFAGRHILLPGDLESPGLESVTADPPLDVDVLLAPHHGSAGSDPPGFAAWCRPDWVVISGRRSSRTGLANRSYQSAGARLIHTAELGAAVFSITPAVMEAKTPLARGRLANDRLAVRHRGGQTE